MNKKSMVRSVALGVIILTSMFSVLSFVEEVSASPPIVVNSAGGGNWLTITEAVNAATNGDTIQIQYGNGYFENVVINKELTIIGTGMTKPILSPATQGSYSPVFDIRERNVTIGYLEFDGTNTNAKAGIKSFALATEVDNVNINECEIHGFQEDGFGIYITRVDDTIPYPTAHLIDENTIYSNNVGIYIESDPDDPACSYNHIVEKNSIYNQIVNDNSEYGVGIFNYGDKNIFQDNRIYSNEENGIELSDSYECDISDSNEVGYPSLMYDNEIGIYINNSDHNDIGGSNDRMVKIYSNNYGMRIVNSEYNEIFYSNFSENSNDGVNTYNGDHTHIHDCDFIEDSETEMIPDSHIELQATDDCTIEDNRIFRDSDDYTSIEFLSSDSNTFEDNIFDGVIEISNGDSNIIKNIVDFRGIEISGGDSNAIYNCDIDNPGDYVSYDACIYIHSANDTLIYDSNLNNSIYGFYISCADDTVICGNTVPLTFDNSEITNIEQNWIYMVTSTTYDCTTYFKRYDCDACDSYDVVLDKDGSNDGGSILRWNNIEDDDPVASEDTDCDCIEDTSF